MLHLPLQGADFYFLSCSAGEPSAPRGDASTLQTIPDAAIGKARASLSI